MKLGVHLPSWSNDDAIQPPERLERFANRAERHGFRSLWVIDHLTRPPSYNHSWLDPFTVLSTLAGVTDAVELGTGILVLPLRHPVLVAKRAATLQYIADGRLTLGLGLGYVEQDFEALGVPYEERSPRFTEGLELVRQLLHEESVTFDGEFFAVEDFELEPTLRRPPRIVVGGSGTYPDEDDMHYAANPESERYMATPVLDRIRRADGWMTTARSLDKTGVDVETVRSYLEDHGQAPSSLDLLSHQYVHLVPRADTETAVARQREVYREYIGEARPVEFAEENYLFGSVSDVVEQIHGYERLGVEQLVLGPVTSDPGELERQLDLWADLLLEEFP